MLTEDQLKYPIGKFIPAESYEIHDLEKDTNRLESFPSKLESVIRSLNSAQLNTPYRPGGWTILQVVHHLADSHMHAYIRTKWALTEEAPLIKAYQEKAWALTAENHSYPSLSIALLESLHRKWAYLLRTLDEESLARHFVHPSGDRKITIRQMVQLYTWHGDHHLGHITGLISRSGWAD
ncbi:MAG: YfiT family bacillithiol transferase [Cyclobacteriaceae bacterium]